MTIFACSHNNRTPHISYEKLSLRSNKHTKTIGAIEPKEAPWDFSIFFNAYKALTSETEILTGEVESSNGNISTASFLASM